MPTRVGMVWQNQKDYDKAMADFNEAIRLEPNDANNLRAGLRLDDAEAVRQGHRRLQ